MDAMDHIVEEGGEGRRYPASCLHETPPRRAGEAYASDEGGVYCTVCGEGYRLYAAFPPGVGAGEAVGRCRALARVLTKDRGALFLARPLAF